MPIVDSELKKAAGEEGVQNDDEEEKGLQLLQQTHTHTHTFTLSLSLFHTHTHSLSLSLTDRLTGSSQLVTEAGTYATQSAFTAAPSKKEDKM